MDKQDNLKTFKVNDEIFKCKQVSIHIFSINELTIYSVKYIY